MASFDINPDALAESGDAELDERDGVQEVDADMIIQYVTERGELPLPESAQAFGIWLNTAWNTFNEEGQYTVGEVIDGALMEWRGN